jgi:hypothetical protein
VSEVVQSVVFQWPGMCALGAGADVRAGRSADVRAGRSADVRAGRSADVRGVERRCPWRAEGAGSAVLPLVFTFQTGIESKHVDLGCPRSSPR